MYRPTPAQLAGFFRRFLLKNSKTCWGDPRWAQQELERLMQWQTMALPEAQYKQHW